MGGKLKGVLWKGCYGAAALPYLQVSLWEIQLVKYRRIQFMVVVSIMLMMVMSRLMSKEL